jgi:hypothetical protein
MIILALLLSANIEHVEPSLKASFDAFTKARKIDPPKSLAVRTVFFIHRDGRSIHSRVYAHDMSGFEDVEYVDDAGRVLFHITDAPTGTPPPSASRIREESLVRAFLLESGYDAVVGITLGKLTHVRIGGRGEHVTLTFRVDGVEYKATSPNIPDQDLKRGKMVSSREQFAECTPGGLLASAVAGKHVTLLFDEPSVWFDAEGGGVAQCARRPGAIVVTLDGPPRVAADGISWTVEKAAL